MKKRLILSAAIAALMSSSGANASVVIGEVTGGRSGGVFEEVVPTAAAPITVGRNNQNSPNLFAMNELQNVTLLSDVAGLAAGTVVSSHYVWFDPQRSSTISGSVTFSSRILAVLGSRSELSVTDYLGNPNVHYVASAARGLERNDQISFSGNTLNVGLLRASSPGDYVRVITAVPEPSTWMMLILGFGMIGAALRFDKARSRSKLSAHHA